MRNGRTDRPPVPVRRALACLTALLTATACGGDGTEAAEEPGVEVVDSGPYLELSADLVERYLLTLDALGAAGFDLELGIEQDPPLLESKPKGLRGVEPYVEVLAKQGLDLESFARLHDNVSLAWFSAESRNPASRYAEDLAERSEMLKDLRFQLPPEQFDAMAGAMIEAQQSLEAQLEAVPATNLEAIAAHRDALSRVFGS